MARILNIEQMRIQIICEILSTETGGTLEEIMKYVEKRLKEKKLANITYGIRTIQNDIKKIKSGNFEYKNSNIQIQNGVDTFTIIRNKHRFKFESTIPEFESLTFNSNEKTSAAFLKRYLNPFREISGIKKIYNKIFEEFEQNEDFNSIFKSISFQQPTIINEREKIILVVSILENIQRNEIIEFFVDSINPEIKIEKIIIKPIHIKFYQHRYYIIGALLSDKSFDYVNLKVVAIDIIRGLKTDIYFVDNINEINNFNHQVDINKYFKHCIGVVVPSDKNLCKVIPLRFYGYAKLLVENELVMHPSQKIVSNTDEYIDIEIIVFDTFELSKELAQFGDFVKRLDVVQDNLVSPIAKIEIDRIDEEIKFVRKENINLKIKNLRLINESDELQNEINILKRIEFIEVKGQENILNKIMKPLFESNSIPENYFDITNNKLFEDYKIRDKYLQNYLEYFRKNNSKIKYILISEKAPNNENYIYNPYPNRKSVYFSKIFNAFNIDSFNKLDHNECLFLLAQQGILILDLFPMDINYDRRVDKTYHKLIKTFWNDSSNSLSILNRVEQLENEGLLDSNFKTYINSAIIAPPITSYILSDLVNSDHSGILNFRKGYNSFGKNNNDAIKTRLYTITNTEANFLKGIGNTKYNLITKEGESIIKIPTFCCSTYDEVQGQHPRDLFLKNALDLP